LAEPEKSLGEFKPLLALCSDDDLQVACWSMLSLLQVFKDVLPGYRIRLPSAAEEAVVVSKEVARVRQFESGLLRAYQAYLKLLLQV
jgi:nucleolar complex protein 3